jgi:L-ribulose-5-phosphate 4-epimerase
MSDAKKMISDTCKILVNQKLDSGPFGNISIRVPGTRHFWVNPEGITFDNIKAEDILLVDLDGQVIEGRALPHPGTFIHRAIYQLREDIQAIVHTHSKNTVMFSLLGNALQPFTQLGAAFYNDQGIYHGFTGPVRDFDEGMLIAEALGNKSLVIAKNHGVFATGKNIQAALWDMVVADQAAEIHCNALRMGIIEAETLAQDYLEKSKNQVRFMQAQFMWENFIKAVD